MTYCLPRKYTAAFIAGLKDGSIDPNKLKNMTSAERRSVFNGIIGEENAKEVNAIFESKLLIANQKKAMTDWVREVAGLKSNVKLDIADKIQSLDRVLNPAEEKAFLADLANKRLGVTVSAAEAKELFDAAKRVSDLKTLMLQAPDNLQARIDYGRGILDLNDKVESMKPDGRTFLQKALDLANVPKTVETGILHFSAPGVQLWGMLGNKEFYKSIPKMFSYFASEDNYKNLNAYIISHPDYKFAKDGGLGLTALGDTLSTREEAIQSSLVEKLNKYVSDKTGAPNVIRASSRAFTGTLNYVRFNSFANLLEAARMADEDTRLGSKVLQDLASAINDFTGRGNLGKGDKYKNFGPVLNTLMYAPRKLVATVEMFNPVRYLDPSVSPTARMARTKQLFGALLATGTVLGLARAMGADVDFDPRSQHFAKIGIGGEYFDMTGGNGIYLRLLTRLATGQYKTSKGDLRETGTPYGGQPPKTRADLALEYVRGKLSPIAAATTDFLYGKDPIGRPFDITEEARERLQPIVLNNFLNFWYNNPDHATAAIPSISSVFGVGMESPLPLEKRFGMNVWGDAVPFYTDPTMTNIDKEFLRLGSRAYFPPDTINGVKLTSDQYKTYIQQSGMLGKIMITNYLNLPGTDSQRDAIKLETMKSLQKTARSVVQARIQLESRGGDNDIMRKAWGVKKENLMKKLGVTETPDAQP